MTEEKNAETKIKYCIAAMIDLLGFSSHLEISSYDLRTKIGNQAIERLQILEKSLDFMNSELSKLPQFYPEKLQVRRINDAIILAIDLDDFLIPSIGQSIRRGFSANELEEFFPEEKLEDDEAFLKNYNGRLLSCVEPLAQFVGLTSRVYNYINRHESESFFPGAKSVIATGIRKPFYDKTGNEDIFSANFSLSNAYIAEQKLKGSFFYIDNYILQLLASHPFTKNVMRYSLFVSKDIMFDPFKEYDDLFYLPNDYVVPSPEEIILFRKSYYFRKLQPSPLTYLQIIPEIMPYLKGEKEANLDHLYKDIYLSIKNGPAKDCIMNKKSPKSMIYIDKNDIEDDINRIPQFISTGKS
jgi:hypothetical protein